MLTYDELDALPENGGLDYEERPANPARGEKGKIVTIPVMRRSFALYYEEGDPVLIRDRNGRAWSVGTGPDGKKYKTRQPLFDA